MSAKTTWFTRADRLGQNSGCVPDHCPVQATADYSIDTVVRKPVVHSMTGESRRRENNRYKNTTVQTSQVQILSRVHPQEESQTGSRFLSFQVQGACIIPCFDSQLKWRISPCSVFLDPWKMTERKKQNQNQQKSKF